jgi:acyl-CoA dehydrogenase
MDLTGFSENQLMVRDAISGICANFPNTYWQECDQLERDPKEFHAALAKAGWLGIALPEEHGGAGLGMTRIKHQKNSPIARPKLTQAKASLKRRL